MNAGESLRDTCVLRGGSPRPIFNFAVLTFSNVTFGRPASQRSIPHLSWRGCRNFIRQQASSSPRRSLAIAIPTTCII
ncbi:hypothetical protein E2C01_047284 [Portunus trituberculatus]|uniref:Uncharacterized protein n=1 Tax=Portunus trituberculatus TaxID=210409 RepID=A0A5B7GA23_PORTR|nr:hypothetical protein [Portunus trituberculatus]